MQLIKITSQDQIPQKYQNTPLGKLIEYQNLGKQLDEYHSAQLLVSMCMDNRKQLRIPENFAYIIRTGGANLRYSEFKVSYAIAIGGIKQVALIAHDCCGMVNLMSKRTQFIDGLVQNAGWDKSRAEEHFLNYAPMFEIDNEAEFVVDEAQRLSKKYPKIEIVPLYYSLSDNQLSFILS
ncbi:carbonic anhydrase [Paludicola sp. MB14-C6]|uniref:carbonic anhydrase n=1 Tax=Paludihabitans sp. MB14-C6 TaxID=3070656 RepID=UPI0027DC147E|nr:carbonic anhydrase [Paludicola sp. MB14-C6]WMJ24119.1 carbonic anhydrase [Paludicola sp. MB14-C6]